MSNTRRLSVFVLAAIVAPLTPSPVLAQSEVVQHDRFSETRKSVDETLCDFPVTVSSSANIDDALFFDDAGNLVRVLETVNRVEIVFSANGKSLTATGTGGIEYLFNPDGSITANTFGINLLMTIPR